jgi:hypothetical protein
MMKYCAFSDTKEKCEYNGRGHQLFIDIGKAYDSVGEEVFYMFSLNLVFPRN